MTDHGMLLFLDVVRLNQQDRRESTLVADERLELLRVTQADFVKVVRQLAAQVHQRKVAFLRRVPGQCPPRGVCLYRVLSCCDCRALCDAAALRLLPSEEIEELAGAMELRVLNTGQHVWTQVNPQLPIVLLLSGLRLLC